MSTKLKCLLLDDELPSLAYLKALCEQVSGLEVVKAFNDATKFLLEQRDLEYDLCIMDIEMPQHSGLDVARHLREKYIIFATAYKEYASEAYDLEATDYIRKPIQKDRLEKAIAKVAAQKAIAGKAKDFVQLNTDKGKALLYFNQIIAISSSTVDKRDKVAMLTTSQQLVLKNISFDELLSLLPQDEFCRINKRDIVALKAVNHYTHDSVTVLKDGSSYSMALSQTYSAKFLDLLS